LTLTENDIGTAADHAVRVPAGMMALLRQSYDTREKVLDWLLAIGVVSAMVWVFRDDLRSAIGVTSDTDPNIGRTDPAVPSMDVRGAFPGAGPSGGRWPALYSYNMPASRAFRYAAGPSGTRPPSNPSIPPDYAE
jgi:hypothetical protein